MDFFELYINCCRNWKDVDNTHVNQTKSERDYRSFIDMID